LDEILKKWKAEVNQVRSRVQYSALLRCAVPETEVK
jgi:hypothetical protein